MNEAWPAYGYCPSCGAYYSIAGAGLIRRHGSCPKLPALREQPHYQRGDDGTSVRCACRGVVAINLDPFTAIDLVRLLNQAYQDGQGPSREAAGEEGGE